jgi:hypothetical protein
VKNRKTKKPPVQVVRAVDLNRLFPELVASSFCAQCADHYDDSGTCDEGKPQASPHRRAR